MFLVEIGLEEKEEESRGVLHFHAFCIADRA